MEDRFFLDREFDAEIDLTPLIDVVFMLLIFFFMASTFIKPAVEVALPKAKTAAPQAVSGKELLVVITADGQIRVGDRLVARSELPDVLGVDPEVKISLHVDEAAPFEAFMVVLDQARASGREDLAIATSPGGYE